MKRFVISILFLSVAISDGKLESFDDLLRFPLTPRNRRAAESLTTVDVRNNRDVQYGVTIEIGTPPQTFSLQLDSGSTDLWVSSTNHLNEGIDHLFNISASKTYQKGNGDFFLGYLDASVNGTIALDTISLGGLTAKSQPFGLADFGGQITGAFDGVFGISYESVAQTDTSTFIDRLYEQGQIKERVSCVKLRPRKESESQYVVGGCDVEADSWIPVLQVNNRYTGWRVNLTKIVLRSTADDSELLTLEPNNESVFDTGATSYVGIPQAFLDPIANSLAATYDGNHYLVNCANRTSLPNVEFYFGEAKVTMTLDTYSWVYNDECQLGFSKGGDDFLFGTLLFNIATIIFDKGNNRIGLAPK